MDLRDLFFPKNCLGCKKSGSYICDQCLTKVAISRPTCPHCNLYSFGSNAHKSCESKTYLKGHLSIWKYGGVVRKAIHALKYRYASDVASELVNKVPELKFSFKNSLLIPIPLHTSREKWRGFNQSELIASLLARKYDVKCAENMLIRLENTTPQVQLDKKERVRNLRGKFAVNREYLSDISNLEKLILVDDVWTTGSTMKEAAKVLKKSGAKEVWGFTLAQ